MQTKTILLVEDDPDDAKLTMRALAKNHIANDVVHVRDGVEALDYLRGTGAHAGRDPTYLPQLVLLDLKTPRLGGLEVLERNRSDPQTRRVPVVILTASKEEQDILKGYDLGANSYIRKPVDYQEFLEAVGNLGLYWLVLNESPPPSAP